MRKAHSKIYQTGLSLRNLIWPAGVVLAVYWLFVGYRFFVNAGIEIVPMIYREIDNGYMANDYWLALKADTTHLRYLFVLFVSKIAKSRDVVEPVLFSIYVLGYVFLVLGLLQLASRQLSSRVSITGATISAVLFLYGFSYVNPGAIFLLPNEATPNLLSRVFLVWVN